MVRLVFGNQRLLQLPSAVLLLLLVLRDVSGKTAYTCGNTALLAATSFTHYQIVNRSVTLTAGVDRKPHRRADGLWAEPIYTWYRSSIVFRAHRRSISTTVDLTSKTYHYDITYRPKVDDLYYKSGNMILEVGEVPSLELLNTINSEFTFIENSDISVPLKFRLSSGTPYPKLKIVKSQEDIRSEKFNISHDAINITDLTIEDGGSYEVTASNCLGNSSVVRINITVWGGIDSIEGQSFNNQSEVRCDGEAKFSCTAVAFPEPEIVWLWDNKMLHNDDETYTINRHVATSDDVYRRKIISDLTIRKPSREMDQNGMIECRSENIVKKPKLVKFPLKVVCQPNECEIEVDKVTNASLTATVSLSGDSGGQPVTHYRVLAYEKRNGADLLKLNEIYLAEGNRSVLVNNLSPYADITLLCSAKNLYGYGKNGSDRAVTKGRPSSSLNVNVTQVDCTSAVLKYRSIAPIEDQIIDYELKYAAIPSTLNTSGFASQPSLSPPRTDTTTCSIHELSSLEMNTQYKVVVRQRNDYGFSDYSSEVYFTTKCLDPEVNIGIPIGISIAVVAFVTLLTVAVAEFLHEKSKLLFLRETFNQPRRAVLLIGPPGSGKSSLITTFNYVVNLLANRNAAYENMSKSATADKTQTEKLLLYDEELYEYLKKRKLQRWFGYDANHGPVFLDTAGLETDMRTAKVILKMLSQGRIAIDSNMHEVAAAIKAERRGKDIAPAKSLARLPSLNDMTLEKAKPTVVLLVLDASKAVKRGSFPSSLVKTVCDELRDTDLDVFIAFTHDEKLADDEAARKLLIKTTIDYGKLPDGRIFFLTNFSPDTDQTFPKDLRRKFVVAFRSILREKGQKKWEDEKKFEFALCC